MHVYHKTGLNKKNFHQYLLNATFSNIMATSFSGGRSWNTRREPPTMGKHLVNFITCGCELSAPFFVIYKAGDINVFPLLNTKK
jgi:hypothetical protein